MPRPWRRAPSASSKARRIALISSGPKQFGPKFSRAIVLSPENSKQARNLSQNEAIAIFMITYFQFLFHFRRNPFQNTDSAAETLHAMRLRREGWMGWRGISGRMKAGGRKQ
jgi:hypothetical protein